MRTLVVATHNLRKGREMVDLLSAVSDRWQIRTLGEYEDAPEPEETSDTYEGNAKIKAHSAALFTGEWAIADDAGLEIDAMPGQLGVYSKRFAGVESTFEQKIERILSDLKGVPATDRTARFQCAVVVSEPSGEGHLFQATCEGRIVEAPRGANGFGYDPIFEPIKEDGTPLGFTMAELSMAEKHRISHRGKVLAKVIEFLRSAP